MSVSTCLRHAELTDMVRLLEQQHTAKLDLVVPAVSLGAKDGYLELSGAAPVLDERGVTAVDGLYQPTAAADSQIAAKLEIPGRYLSKLRTENRLDLYDANVNSLLHGHPDGAAPEDRSFLLRLFTGDTGEAGLVRAFLSDRYGVIDNLDVLTAVLDGIRQADSDARVRECDLSETSMHCKVFSPNVSALAPNFLAGYRSPFTNPDLAAEWRKASGDLARWRPIAAREGRGYQPGTEPVLFAGFRIANSETGHHALTLKPELVVKVCGNGLTIPLFTQTRRHLGERLSGGALNWSQDTLHKKLAVITAETRDTVMQWLSPQFLNDRVAELEQQAATPIREPEKTLEVVATQVGFSDAERAGILTHFIAGGQLSAAGLANAVTSYSQTVPDPARADALDDLALRTMTLV